jgi:putative addiction module killer protein
MKDNVEKEIIIYSTEEGREPFSDWLDSLDKSCAARVSKRLLRVLLGNLGDYKSLGDGLYELRFNEGIRVYFSQIGKTLLLTGGNKNTKRDQSADIEKAREYLRSYRERENGRKI